MQTQNMIISNHNLNFSTRKVLQIWMYVIVSINANYISPVDKLFVERSKKNSRKNMLISMSRLLFLLKTYFFCIYNSSNHSGFLSLISIWKECFNVTFNFLKGLGPMLQLFDMPHTEVSMIVRGLVPCFKLPIPCTKIFLSKEN